MSKCPVDGCEKVKEHDIVIYGEKQDGLTYKMEKKVDQSCLNKYIKRPPGWLIVLIITVIIIPTYGTGWKVWFGQEISQYVYASSDRVNEVEEKVDKNDKEIGIIKEQIHRIDQTTAKTNEEVKKINGEMEKINTKIDRQNAIQRKEIGEQFRNQFEQFKMLIESIKK